MDQTKERLHIMAICYYTLGGLSILSCLLLYPAYLFTLGILKETSSELDVSMTKLEPIIHIMILLYVLCGVFNILNGVVFFLAGKYLAACRYRGFCLLAAWTAVLLFPIGTILGVFTIMELKKPAMRECFAASTDVEPPAQSTSTT